MTALQAIGAPRSEAPERANPLRRALFEHVNHDHDLGILFRDVSSDGLKYPWHFHPELELTHIVRGSGLRYVGDSIEPFAEGDLCLIGSETPHCWLTELGCSGRTEARVIQFLPELIASPIQSTLTFRPLRTLFQRARRGLRITGMARERTSEAMRVLFTERERPLDRYAGLLAILADLSESTQLSELALSDLSRTSDTSSAETAAKLLAYVHEHAQDPELSFDRAARALGMSRATFGRAFPRLFGKTFVKYLAEVRVEQACRMLGETSRTVTEIAIETGFGSLSNFNRQFLSLKKTSPLRYRKSTRARDLPRV
ncbi:MAG TPA: AraC family transcriptional regulator [Polyangiaceae bacterium]